MNQSMSYCKSCLSSNVMSAPHSKYEHCFKVTCLNCHRTCHVCVQHNRRFDNSNMHRLRQHFTSCQHIIITNDIDTSHNQDNDQTIINDSEDSDSLSRPNAKRSKSDNPESNETTNIINQSLFVSPSAIYFDDEKLKNGNGICGIVGRSFAQNLSSDNRASIIESQFHLKAATFCVNMTQQNQSEFCDLLLLASQIKFKSTRIPTSIQDVRRFYTKNKYSVYNNIPSPIVIDKDNHACVSLTSVIDHVLAHGTVCDLLSTDSTLTEESNNIELSNVKEARDIITSVQNEYSNESVSPKILYLILWSDDFEVNHIRKNRNSTWIKTVTICPPKGQSTSTNHTQAIALGKKSQDHSLVNDYHNSELELLSKCQMRYVGSEKSYLPIVVKVLAMSADRPERATINCMLAYNGKTSRRWKYSALVNIKKLPSCLNCLRQRIYQVYSSHPTNSVLQRCISCSDWEFNADNTATHFFPPNNYPHKKNTNSPLPPASRDVIPKNSNMKLKPIQLTYSILKSSLRFAVYNYYHQDWNKEQTKTYLQLVGVSTSCAESAIAYAKSCRACSDPISNLLENLPIPTMWKSTNIRLEQFIDTPMHQLFQGIVNSIIVLTMDFFKANLSRPSFGKFANKILNQIKKLNCSFCKAEPFNGDEYTTGGWISETYLGYSRVMVILFSHNSLILDSNIRGYDELSATVQVLHALLSRLMTHRHIDTTDIRNYIKLFLSMCDIFDTHTYEREISSLIWYAKPNFLSLMNIPDQIDQFGPVYLHWDGVRERYIQVAKPLLKNMRSSLSYLLIKLQELHRKSVLQRMMIDNCVRNTKQYERYSTIKSYPNLESIRRTIDDNECFLGMTYKEENTASILVKAKEGYSIYKLEFDDSLGFHRCNQWFSPMSVKENVCEQNPRKKSILENIIDYILFVPYSTDGNEDLNGYSAVTKDWMIRNEHGLFILPKPSEHLIGQIFDKL